MYIDTETLMIAIYLVVDNWYLTEGCKYLRGKVGKKPEFTDSGMITFMILKELLQFKAERKFLGFMRGNHSDMFPDIVDQSQFNRRSRALRLILDRLRSHFADELGVQLASLYVLDTEAVPVVGYRRSKKNSDFLGSAEYGYCASKKLHYWGYKCIMLVTADGTPVAFELVPANTDERDAAEEVLPAANPGSIALGDKGFIDEERQEYWKQHYGVTVYTFKRRNQHKQNPPVVQQLLNENRRQIETTFPSLDRVEGLEDHGAKTVLGLVTRTIAKVTAYRTLARKTTKKGIAKFTLQERPSYKGLPDYTKCTFPASQNSPLQFCLIFYHPGINEPRVKKSSNHKSLYAFSDKTTPDDKIAQSLFRTFPCRIPDILNLRACPNE